MSKIININKKELIQLSTEWCGPCKALRKRIKESYLSQDKFKNIPYKFIDLDVPDNEEWTKFMISQGLSSVPQLFIKTGESLERVDRHQLDSIFNTLISEDETDNIQDSSQETGETTNSDSVQEIQEQED